MLPLLIDAADADAADAAPLRRYAFIDADATIAADYFADAMMLFRDAATLFPYMMPPDATCHADAIHNNAVRLFSPLPMLITLLSMLHTCCRFSFHAPPLPLDDAAAATDTRFRFHYAAAIITPCVDDER